MVMMRRTILAVALLLPVAGMATASPAVAQPTAGNPTDVAADFDHDGFADLAVRVRGENDLHRAVNVLDGTGGGLSGTGGQVFSQVGGAPEFLDRFGRRWRPGTSTVTGLPTWPAGASGEDVNGVVDAGAVSVRRIAVLETMLSTAGADLLFACLRLRSGSLLAPTLAHAATNASAYRAGQLGVLHTSRGPGEHRG
jgi:hypothetical protein